MRPMHAFAIVPILAFLAMAALWIFLLVVVWRFMRAHERLADAAEKIARRNNEEKPYVP